MGVWKFSGFVFVLRFFFFFFFSFLWQVVSWGFSLGMGGLNSFITLYLSFDMVGVYLVFLTVVLSVCVVFLYPWLRVSSFVLILLRQLFSLCCYVCCHALFFWGFYECRMVILLFLLLRDSPYSERYSAFWYFLGYILFRGLPMLMSLLYFSFVFGSFRLLCWDLGEEEALIIILLSFLFMTKIPLFPFQAWLPIVHAESRSVVSVCLRGYIMKLGVLGMFRFCFWVVPYDLFFFSHVGFMMFFALFFLVCSRFELDGKRWLAFLSLSHIKIVPLCLCVVSGEKFGVGFCYCLGHGLSSSITFFLLWFLSYVTGRRNWFFLKGGVVRSLVWQFILVACFCVCSSFPPTLQFFCELKVLCFLRVCPSFVFYFMCLYLFLGGLVPFICLGHLLIRGRRIRFSWRGLGGPLLVLMCLFVLNIFCFLFF